MEVRERERGRVWPELGRGAAAAIAGGELLAGECLPGAVVHQTQNREYREKEENDADSFPSPARPEEDPHRAVRGGAMDDALGAREQGPRGHETEREKLREKKGE
jgi:hypothetical protein